MGGENQPSHSSEPTWQEGAGSLLLLAAAHETGLISALSQALPTDARAPRRLAHAKFITRRQSFLTLLFLPSVGLRLLAGRALSIPGSAFRRRRDADRCPRCLDLPSLACPEVGAKRRATCLLRGWAPQARLQRSLDPTRPDRAYGQSAGRTRPPAPARRPGASTPRYHPPR